MRADLCSFHKPHTHLVLTSLSWMVRLSAKGDVLDEDGNVEPLNYCPSIERTPPLFSGGEAYSCLGHASFTLGEDKSEKSASIQSSEQNSMS